MPIEINQGSSNFQSSTSEASEAPRSGRKGRSKASKPEVEAAKQQALIRSQQTTSTQQGAIVSNKTQGVKAVVVSSKKEGEQLGQLANRVMTESYCETRASGYLQLAQAIDDNEDISLAIADSVYASLPESEPDPLVAEIETYLEGSNDPLSLGGASFTLSLPSAPITWGE